MKQSVVSEKERIQQLERDLKRARREIEQWKRTAETSEAMSHLSKKNLLRSNAELEEAIERAKHEKRKAEHANEAKGRFLAIMSHEIRTPMFGVLGTLELLRDSELSEENQELAEIAHESSKALLMILNDTLDFSKIESGTLSLDLRPFHLTKSVRSVLDTMRSAAKRRDLELNAEISTALPDLVVGDGVRLRQILLNLIGNAIKFTDEGYLHVRVYPTTRQDGVRFEVEDTGIGIGEGDRATVFDVFQQADDSTTRRHGGTGLGLAICRTLVEMMDGEIEVASELGRGSTFSFEIALPGPGDTDEYSGTTHSSAVATTSAAAGCDHSADVPAPRQRPRALVVDDDEVNRLITARSLINIGFHVETAGDGMNAVGCVEEEDFDVVFMDCGMPLIDGLEATRRIRQLGIPRAGTPVVALTARPTVHDRTRCLAAGMNDYIVKPITRPELDRVLRHLSLA